MKDYLNIGSSPVDEPCCQVGQVSPQEQKAECRRFMEQLNRQFPPPNEHAYFGIKGFPHDVGTYYEVVAYFDDDNQESVDWAFNVEANTPENWEEEMSDYLKQQQAIQDPVTLVCKRVNEQELYWSPDGWTAMSWLARHYDEKTECKELIDTVLMLNTPEVNVYPKRFSKEAILS